MASMKASTLQSKMIGPSSLSWPCPMVLTRTSCIGLLHDSKAPEELKVLQFNRRLLLLYTPSQGFNQQPRVLCVWHLMHATAGCYRVDRSPGRRHKEYGAESCGGNSRQSTILRCLAREAEYGHWSLVRAKVRLDLQIKYKDHTLKRQQRLHRCRHLEGW